MGYKTGKSVTLSFSGTMTGTIGNGHVASTGPYYLFGSQQASFSMNYGGAGVSGYVKTYPFVNPPTIPPPDDWIAPVSRYVTVSANGDTQTYADGWFGGDVWGSPGSYPFDLTGSYSGSIDCEEVIDFPFNNDFYDYDYGVFNPTPTVNARVYLQTVVGGHITCTMSWMGVTASNTTTITTAYEVDPALSCGMSAGMGPSPSFPFPQNGSASLSGSFTVSPSVSFPSQSFTGSAGGDGGGGASSTASLSGGGFAVSGSASYGEGPTSLGTHPDDIYSVYLPNAIGSASATMYPSKTYSMVGQIFALDRTYSGLVPIDFSKYNGDPDPHLNGPSFSASYSQQKYSYGVNALALVETRKYYDYPDEHDGVNLFEDITTDGSAGHSDSLNQFQTIGGGVSSGWCDEHNEKAYYTATDGVNTVNRHLYNNPLRFHGFLMSGMNLALQNPFPVADNTLTNWSGAKVVESGLGNINAANMVRSFSPFFNMSGYRYLKLSGCSTTASYDQSRTLTINGKTWTIKFKPHPHDVIIDLCVPETGGAEHDTTDSGWPDGNPTLSGGFSAPEGPLWGVNYVTALVLSGFTTSTTEWFNSIDLIHKNDLTGQFCTTWEPRWGRMIENGPYWDNDSDTSFERKENRSFILTADGRQSFECDGRSLLQIIGGGSGIVIYIPTNYSVTNTVNRVNAGYVLDGGGSPYASYTTKPVGWVATDVSPIPSGDGRVWNDYMNGSLPSSWMWGDGVIYTGTGEGQGFKTGIGVNPASVPVQVLMNSVDFYPSCGDVFGFGPGGGSDSGIYLAASKVYMAQAWGILVDKKTKLPIKNQDTALYPTGTDGIQDINTCVGQGSSDVQGMFRTSGIGLNGIDYKYQYHDTPSGTDIYDTFPSSGIVNQVVQTFKEGKLSRVAFAVANATKSNIGMMGPQPSDVYTGISLPAGGASPRLHMVVQREQLTAGLQATWDVSTTGDLVHATAETPFVLTVKIPIRYTNTGVKYLSSFDFGKSWNKGIDLGVKAADGTALVDGLSGTEIWAVQIKGYFTSGFLNVVDSQIIYPNYCVEWGHTPWKYRSPRATALNFGDDGSIYTNGVIGDYYQDIQGYTDFNTDTAYTPPEGTDTDLLPDYIWQSGKRTINTAGTAAWRDCITSNFVGEICPLNPIWGSRGSSHGNRGNDGENGGPTQLLTTNYDGQLLLSDDLGDHWINQGIQGGSPQQSNIWFQAGTSFDNNDTNIKSVDDYRNEAEVNDSLYRTQAYHKEQLETVTANFVANVFKTLELTAIPAPVDTMLSLSRVEDKQYGILKQRGWSTGFATIIVISVINNFFDDANGAQNKLQSSCQEMIIQSTDAGRTWKFVAVSIDGCQTWNNVNPLVATSGSNAVVRDAVSGNTYTIALS